MGTKGSAVSTALMVDCFIPGKQQSRLTISCEVQSCHTGYDLAAGGSAILYSDGEWFELPMTAGTDDLSTAENPPKKYEDI